MTAYRYYKIGNTWTAWLEAHNLYGYTKTPTTSITYKSTNPSTWGDPVSPASGYYDGEVGDPISGSYFSAGTMGWFDANRMASFGRMPNECVIDDDFMFTDGTVVSECAKLRVIAPIPPIEANNNQQNLTPVDATPDYYLIASAVNLGWHTIEEWDELGWTVHVPENILFGGDFSGNDITVNSVDGGGGLISRFAQTRSLFPLIGWDAGGNIEEWVPVYMVPMGGVLDGTSDSITEIDNPEQLTLGHIEFTGELWPGMIPMGGVIEED